MKKTYIIVGSNNFWYSTFEAETIQDVEKQVLFVKETIKENFDNPLGTPIELFVYEASLIIQATV